MRRLAEQQALDERDEFRRAAAPAGGMAVSVSVSVGDMAKRLQLRLAPGKLPDGNRLFSEASHFFPRRMSASRPRSTASPDTSCSA